MKMREVDDMNVLYLLSLADRQLLGRLDMYSEYVNLFR